MGHGLKQAVAAFLAFTALAPAARQDEGKAGKADAQKPGQAKPQGSAKAAGPPKPDQAQAPKAAETQAPKAARAEAPKPVQAAQAPKQAQAPAPKPAQAAQAPKQAQAPAPKPAQVAQTPKQAQNPNQAQPQKPAEAAAPKPARTAQAPKPAQTPAPKPAQAAAQKPPQAQASKPAQAARAPKAAPAPAKKADRKPAQKPSKKQGRKPARREPLPAFQENPAVAEFIGRMAAGHGFDAGALASMFSAIGPNERVLTLFRPVPPKPRPQPRQTPPKAAARSWKKYSAVFLNESRIEGGARFWRDNAAALERAHRQYGVPPEIIVAIIGVETLYGERTGGFCVMEALASLAFHDPMRGGYFMEELEHFLLLSRENGFDPLRPQGSYAGAMGIPQFMPGSWRRFAVDFDGDGRIDLEGSFADSIGSVANYLSRHGWQGGEPVAHRAEPAAAPDPAWAQAGMLPSLSVEELRAGGVKVEDGGKGAPDTATFIELPTPRMPTEYWLGYRNYYAITRYNRSHYYSMSVFLLAEAIRARGPMAP